MASLLLRSAQIHKLIRETSAPAEAPSAEAPAETPAETEAPKEEKVSTCLGTAIAYV